MTRVPKEPQESRQSATTASSTRSTTPRWLGELGRRVRLGCPYLNSTVGADAQVCRVDYDEITHLASHERNVTKNSYLTLCTDAIHRFARHCTRHF